MLSQVICFPLTVQFAPFLASCWVQIPKSPMAGEPSWVEHGLQHFAVVVSTVTLVGMESDIPLY